MKLEFEDIQKLIDFYGLEIHPDEFLKFDSVESYKKSNKKSTKIGRNEKCPCGCGLKFKFCKRNR